MVEPVYEDNDLSAFSGKRRPGYEQLLADAKAGRINVIVAWHADRLTRQPIENEALIELAERHGIQFATVTGEHDLATPSGRLHFRMLGSIARYESEHRAERLRLKFQEQARDGRPKGGGRRPFGFDADKLTVNEPEAALLRDAAERLLAGEGLYAILRDWRARGVITPAGNLWSPTSLRRALLAPRTAGLREHHGEVLGPAAWPSILDELTRKRLVDCSPATAAGGRAGREPTCSAGLPPVAERAAAGRWPGPRPAPSDPSTPAGETSATTVAGRPGSTRRSWTGTSPRW